MILLFVLYLLSFGKSRAFITIYLYPSRPSSLNVLHCAGQLRRGRRHQAERHDDHPAVVHNGRYRASYVATGNVIPRGYERHRESPLERVSSVRFKVYHGDSGACATLLAFNFSAFFLIVSSLFVVTTKLTHWCKSSANEAFYELLLNWIAFVKPFNIYPFYRSSFVETSTNKERSLQFAPYSTGWRCRW